MVRRCPGVDLRGDQVADMRLRPQKTRKDSAVGGRRENGGERGRAHRDQERSKSIPHHTTTPSKRT
jgi:hypothetical protein